MLKCFDEILNKVAKEKQHLSPQKCNEKIINATKRHLIATQIKLKHFQI